MPSNWLYIDTNFPSFTQKESVNDKVETMQDYLFMLVEQLRYTLHNLDLSNMNKTATDEFVKQITDPIYGEIKDAEGNITQVALAISRNVRAVYDDLAGLDFRRLRQKMQDALAQHALAAAGFADDGEHHARSQRKAHVAHRLHLARGGEKADGKVLDVQ